MKYYFENKLIGVGVVDILPHGLSSVYYFYDPQYK
jgi:arginine-tRNA-protein transferase